MTTYTELSIKDLIAQQRAIIREMESKHFQHQQQATMGRALVESWKASKHPEDIKRSRDTKVQAQQDEAAVSQMALALPILRAQLDDLMAQDATNDAADGEAADGGAA